MRAKPKAAAIPVKSAARGELAARSASAARSESVAPGTVPVSAGRPSAKGQASTGRRRESAARGRSGARGGSGALHTLPLRFQVIAARLRAAPGARLIVASSGGIRGLRSSGFDAASDGGSDSGSASAHISPYQPRGNRRCFGYFFCDACSKRWQSGNSWGGYTQECKSCKVPVLPYLQRALRRVHTEEEREPHPVELCAKCQELGDNCQKLRSSI